MIISTLPAELDRIEETTVKYVRRDGPISFDEFLDMFLESGNYVELIDGCVVEKPMVGWEHEDLLLWLTRVAALYVEDHDLGIVAGSRTAVRISPLGSRLPDFFFVAKHRQDIIQQKAVMEAPDLVIEVRSASNTASEIVALESDYQAIGIPEIILIDPKRRHVRVNTLKDGAYVPEEVTDGALNIRSIPGLWFDLRWLFDLPRLPVREALARIEQGSAGS